MDEPKELKPLPSITVAETARRLSVGLNHVYGLLYAGKLTGRKVRGMWQVDRESVVRYRNAILRIR